MDYHKRKSVRGGNTTDKTEKKSKSYWKTTRPQLENRTNPGQCKYLSPGNVILFRRTLNKNGNKEYILLFPLTIHKSSNCRICKASFKKLFGCHELHTSASVTDLLLSYYCPQTKFGTRYCFTPICLFTGRSLYDVTFCLLPGPMFLLWGLCLWSHVPSGGGGSVQEVSV